MYIARKNGVERELTEAEVRAEIIDTLQHDISATIDHSDQEIAAAVTDGDLNDYFDGPTFEGFNCQITRSV